MVLFELLQLVRVFLDYLWIEYLWHVLIMPLTNRIGIPSTVFRKRSLGDCARKPSRSGWKLRHRASGRRSRARRSMRRPGSVRGRVTPERDHAAASVRARS